MRGEGGEGDLGEGALQAEDVDADLQGKVEAWTGMCDKSKTSGPASGSALQVGVEGNPKP